MDAHWNRPCLANDLDEPLQLGASQNTSVAAYQPYIAPEVTFLSNHGMDRATLRAATVRARSMGVSAATVLTANGVLNEESYHQCMAYDLGVAYAQQVPELPDWSMAIPNPRDLKRMSCFLSATTGSSLGFTGIGRGKIYVAPDARQLKLTREFLEKSPQSRGRIEVASPSVLMKQLRGRLSNALTDNAIEGLWRSNPRFSCRVVISPRQAIVLTLLILITLFQLWSNHYIASLCLYALLTTLYLGSSVLNFLAAVTIPMRGKTVAELPTLQNLHPADLPIYSILVPLRREAGQVEALVGSLWRLDWPREKLEIFLICEADDKSTQAACAAAIDGHSASVFTLVAVPVSQPQTKPKALNYVLPLCSGEFVVVYDAEDRPHPQQLREAHELFRVGESNLACVQAPLVIHNSDESLLSCMTAVEYSNQFSGLLPLLAQSNMPVPLGGTSNHFRASALRQAGGWDPFNVTEDADLGIRLSRLGMQVKTSKLPTYEEAPVHWNAWLRQRTRWQKGKYQTWLTHMRYPLLSYRELGWKSMLAFQVLFAGTAVSALFHPVLWLLIGQRMLHALDSMQAGPSSLLLATDTLTISFGYAAFLLLAIRTQRSSPRGAGLRVLVFLPVYWIMLACPAWRAAWQLTLRPSLWEKTDHTSSEPKGKQWP